AVYVLTVLEEESRKAEDGLQRLRLARANGIVSGLCDLGSERPLLGKSPEQVRSELAHAIQSYAALLERPPGASPPPPERLQRARMLAVLDRLEEATALLAPLADNDGEAALLRAAVLQDQERWNESNADYRRALDLLTAAGPASAAGRVRAYDGLAFNARGQK